MITWRRVPVGSVFQQKASFLPTATFTKIGWNKWIVHYENPEFRELYVTTSLVKMYFKTGTLTLIRKGR